MNNKYLINYVNTIPYSGLPNLMVNRVEFQWNGRFWEFKA